MFTHYFKCVLKKEKRKENECKVNFDQNVNIGSREKRKVKVLNGDSDDLTTYISLREGKMSEIPRLFSSPIFV